MKLSEMAENRCENCVDVDRGVDECCHETHHVSDRCPLSKKLHMYQTVNYKRHSIEWSTGLTGCRFFRLDQDYQRHNDEVDRINRERNMQHAKEKGLI